MKNTLFTRRFILLGIASLAGCQANTTRNGSDDAVTDVFDGEYVLTFGRLWNPTPANLKSKSYRTEVEELAFLRATVVNGTFSVLRVDDSGAGTNYGDFTGKISSNGVLNLSTTVGYLKSKVSPFKLRVNAPIGDQLRTGNSVSLRPSGYDASFSAHLNIRKTG